MVPRPGLAAAALALAALPAAAQPSPTAARAQRKPASLELSAEALGSFVDAIIADKAGDLVEAERRYLESIRRTPHPHTYFNLADVQRRMEKIVRGALDSYRKYLELAPDAPDRRAVERLIRDLETMPGTAVIEGESLDAVVFVDGVLIGPSPVAVQLADGRHTVDRVGPTGYRQRAFTIKRGELEYLQLHDSRDDTGNVVIGVSPQLTSLTSWTDDAGRRWRVPGRFALPPGTYEQELPNRRGCAPIRFEVPRGDHVIYVYLDAKAPETRGGCQPLAVRAQKVRFPP